MAAARHIIEKHIIEKWSVGALPMCRLAAEVGMQSPSLCKHVPTKRSVEAALAEGGMFEFGAALHAALSDGGQGRRGRRGRQGRQGEHRGRPRSTGSTAGVPPHLLTAATTRWLRTDPW